MASLTGQHALRPLPPPTYQGNRTVGSYPIPEVLRAERKNLKAGSNAGIAVQKVAKTGKLQARRVAFSSNHRSIFVTSMRVKSFKGLLKYVSNSHQTTAKTIDLSQIQTILRGPLTNRFLMARSTDAIPLEAAEIHDENDQGCLSIVYRVPTEQALGSGGNNLAANLLSPGGPGGGGGGAPSADSILLNNKMGPHRFDTLDLYVPNPRDYEVLLTVLEDLVQLYRQEVKTCNRWDLFCEYHWLEMDKSLDGKVTEKEFVSLCCERMGFPSSKRQRLMKAFTQFCHNHDAEADFLALDLEQVQELIVDDILQADGRTLMSWLLTTSNRRSRGDDDDDYYDEQDDPDDNSSFNRKRASQYAQVADPVDAVWNAIIDTDPVPPVTPLKAVSSIASDARTTASKAGVEMGIDVREQTMSKVAFLSFLRANQREYQTTLRDVAALIRVMNFGDGSGTSPDYDDDSRLTKSQFRAYLFSDTNDWLSSNSTTMGASTDAEEDQDDMSQPLSAYWINTSHDTYMARMPNWGNKMSRNALAHHPVDLQSYWHALNRGARCVECRVWDGIYGEPVIARFQPKRAQDAALPFLDVLNVLAKFLEMHPDSFPIILCMENHCSYQKQQIMAKDLIEILGSLLFKPRDLASLDRKLPSPEQLRGKVVLKAKRPKVIHDGATVMNDDFDEENDVPSEKFPEDDGVDGTIAEDEEGEADGRGVVIGFDAAGPIRSQTHDETMLPRSPSHLLVVAEEEAEQADEEVLKAERRVEELHKESREMEFEANALAKSSGLPQTEIKRRALTGARGSAARDANQQEEADLSAYTKSLDENEDPATAQRRNNTDDSQGLEVQDFYGEAVDGAKSKYSEADRIALEAKAASDKIKRELDESNRRVRTAEANLQASYDREISLQRASRKAQAEARANRQHADTAKLRVEEVRSLLKNVKTSANSAETVVVTAMTEAKISEERAAQTEARASRALAAADRDRSKAAIETKKEEELEQQAARYHEICLQKTKMARAARERMEKAATMLDRLNEQLKLIEKSSQYRKEVDEANRNGTRYDGYEMSSPLKTSKFIAKHANKMEERRKCTDLIKEASRENSEAEVERRRSQSVFEEAANRWKKQSDVASQARKQADRSSQSAEELAEHAEEEREAANLRHIAREKAQSSVKQSDSTRSSTQAQLAEAERASAEAASLAIESRKKADRLEREAKEAMDHSEAQQDVEVCKAKRDVTKRKYEIALVELQKADEKATDAKRLYDTSSEVFSTAKQTAAVEIHQANVQRHAERSAVDSYSKYLLTKKEMEEARRKLDVAERKAEEKATAARHAREYKAKMDNVHMVAPDLAKLVTLHSTKYRNWEVSNSLAKTHMHSLSTGHVSALEERQNRSRELFLEFTNDHLMRLFPSWKPQKEDDERIDVVSAHTLGCQMVGMNFMSASQELLVNDGRFRVNDSCGYVLKPPNLGIPERPQTWKLGIVCGSLLPRPETEKRGVHSLDPYIELTLFEGDGERNTFHVTKVIRRNSIYPVWNERNITMEVNRPSVAILLLTVWDSATKDFVAASSVPVANLRQGYRSVALFDSLHSRCGPYAFANLLIEVRKAKVG